VLQSANIIHHHQFVRNEQGLCDPPMARPNSSGLKSPSISSHHTRSGFVPPRQYSKRRRPANNDPATAITPTAIHTHSVCSVYVSTLFGVVHAARGGTGDIDLGLMLIGDDVALSVRVPSVMFPVGCD